MIYFEYLTENKKVLGTLLKMGYLSTSIPRNMEIYKYYSDVVAQGNSKSLAFCSTQDRFDVNYRKLYRIIKKMEEVLT